MNIKNLLQKLKENLTDPEKPYWILGSLILIAMVLLISNKKTPDFDESNKAFAHDPPVDSPPIDTFVPNGFVLVTLQLVNVDSIDSMMGSYGMVDLYPASPSEMMELENISKNARNKSTTLMDPIPLATHVRMIRAPNNMKLFGALIPEGSRQLIQQLSSPVFAVIQRPDAKPTQNLENKRPSAPNSNTNSNTSPDSQSPSRTRIIQYGDL